MIGQSSRFTVYKKRPKQKTVDSPLDEGGSKVPKYLDEHGKNNYCRFFLRPGNHELHALSNMSHFLVYSLTFCAFRVRYTPPRILALTGAIEPAPTLEILGGLQHIYPLPQKLEESTLGTLQKRQLVNKR